MPCIKNNIIRFLVCIGLVTTLFNTPIFAAEWYKDYLQAEKELEDRNWREARDLLQEALKKEPEPGNKKKTYGLRFIKYYPYLRLGEAYLKLNDLKNAGYFCEMAQKKGIAPGVDVSRCLRNATVSPSPTARPLPQPTKRPTPTQRIDSSRVSGGIYVSNVSFFKPGNKRSLGNSTPGRLLNEAVSHGITLACHDNARMRYNASGHIVSDIETNLKKLIEISYHDSLQDDVQIQRIIQGLMQPSQVDILVSGQYIDRGTTIQLRPFALFRLDKQIITKEVTFQKQDFLCSNSQSLCLETYNDIVELVRDLVGQL